MKRLTILLTVFFMFLAVAISCSNSNEENKKASSDFKIYLVKETDFSKLIDAELEDIPLDDEPLITEEDISVYYWKGQSDKVSSLFELQDDKTLTEIMKDRGYAELGYYPFIVTVGDERMYLGALYSPLTSVSPPQGINIFISTIPLNSVAYEISEEDSKGLIHNNRIYEALERAEILILEKHELIRSLDDLYSSYHSLKIQKNGEDAVYDADKALVYIFGDMLSKVEELDMNLQEEGELTEGFDYTYWDYRLQFEGAADIFFTLEGNVFHFDGETQLYTLWGDSKPLWDSLVFDNGNQAVNITKEKIQVMVKNYAEDVNGDGIDENIELSYERVVREDLKGDLTVSINGSKATALKDEEWFTKPYRTIGEMPKIKFQQEQNGKRKAVLLIYSWATNGIGSTGVINAYEYVEGDIREVKIKDAERVIKYMGENNVNVSFPALNSSIDLKIDTDEFKRFLGEKGSFKQQLEAKDTFYPHPLWYTVEDYDGDGQPELCSVSILRCPPLALCKLHTYYKYENGELKPVQVSDAFTSTNNPLLPYNL